MHSHASSLSGRDRLGRSTALLVTALISSTGCVSVQGVPAAANLPERIELVELGEPLTLTRAVEVALANDPRLRAARWQVSGEYWRKVQASRLPNPSLYGTLSPSEWFARLSLALSDLADVGGRRQAKVDASQSREDQAVLEALRREIELTRDVRTVFVELTGAADIEGMLREKEDATTRGLSLVEDQHEEGAASERDSLAAATATREATLARKDAEARRAALEAELNRFLGRPPDAPLLLDKEADAGLSPLRAPQGNEALAALSNRPEIALVLAKQSEHRARLRYVRALVVPSVSGGPLLTKPDEDADPELGGALEITIPLLDAGGAQRGEEAAILGSLAEELIDAEAAAVLEIHLAAMALARAEERVRVDYPALLAPLERTLVISRGAYDEGASSALDVTAAEAGALDMRVNVRRAEVERLKAEIQLAAALGESGRSHPVGSDAGDHGRD